MRWHKRWKSLEYKLWEGKKIMEFSHFSVMLDECITGLNIDPNGIYVDGTAGGAGHSSEIAKHLVDGKLFAFDQDPHAVKVATERLAQYKGATVVKANFSQMEYELDKADVNKVDGILMDLGVSSYQLDNGDRGFSYNYNAPLDMRMSMEGLSAYDVVNTYEVRDIMKILREYGEERFAKNIAYNIVKARQVKPIETTFELGDIIKASVPGFARAEKNPCKRSFQAIRIEVNGELTVLKNALESGFELLKPGGRFVVITFHSLEDRIVKQQFASYCKGCTCPSDFPQCVCGNEPKAKLINRKPITASLEELDKNSRSKSAKLRILEKL